MGTGEIIAIVAVCAGLIGVVLGVLLDHKLSKSRDKTQNEQGQIKELQEKLALLEDENAKLKDLEAFEKRIKPIRNILFQLEGDTSRTIYCYLCWGKEHKKIPVLIHEEGFNCNNCNTGGNFHQDNYSNDVFIAKTDCPVF